MCQRSHQMGEGGRAPGTIEPREHGRRIVLTTARHVALGKLREVDRRERVGPPQTVLPCSRSRMASPLPHPRYARRCSGESCCSAPCDRCRSRRSSRHCRPSPSTGTSSRREPLEVSRSSGTCAACIRRTFGCRSCTTTLVLAQAVTRRTGAASHVVGCR